MLCILSDIFAKKKNKMTLFNKKFKKLINFTMKSNTFWIIVSFKHKKIQNCPKINCTILI